MATVSFSEDLDLAESSRPKHEKQHLSNDKLLILYYCAAHAKHDGSRLVKREGLKLKDDVIKGISRVLVNNLEAPIPRVIAIFKQPNEALTKKVAEVAEKTPDRLDELFGVVEDLNKKHVARIEAIKEKKEEKKRPGRERARGEREERERRKREREATPTGTDLKLADSDLPHLNGRQVTRSALLDIYAARCLYDYGGKELDKVAWRRLFGIIIDKPDGPITSIPRFVSKFVDEPIGTKDKVTKEVRRVAPLLKEYLLGRVGDACKRCQEFMSTSQGFTDEFSREQQPPIPRSRPTQTGFIVPQVHPPAYGLAPHGEDVVMGHWPQASPRQSQNLALHGQQAPVSKESPAPSFRELSISSSERGSSSGRSASPGRAERKRQEEDEKARRGTAKGDSKKRGADEGAKKKSGDSRQKEADTAKDKARKGRHTRP